MNRLELLAIVKDYLDRDDVEGLRDWVMKVEPVIRSSLEEARQRRMKSMGRSIKPIRRIGELVCFDETDLYWLLSRASIRRLGLE